MLHPCMMKNDDDGKGADEGARGKCLRGPSKMNLSSYGKFINILSNYKTLFLKVSLDTRYDDPKTSISHGRSFSFPLPVKASKQPKIHQQMIQIPPNIDPKSFPNRSKIRLWSLLPFKLQKRK